MSLLDALIQVESNGRAGIQGPQTPYGRAKGLTQMLDGTAREMALKLGVPWRPDLMTAPTDEGAQYQRQLGNAYLQEGLERTGNERDALRYYHGGPDRHQWGPKTNAYADKVMGLAGNETPMMQPNIPPVFQGGMEEQPSVANQGSLASLIQMNPVNLQTPEVKPHAFDKGGKGWVIAGIIADAIAGGFGGRGGFAPTYLANQQDERENEQRLAEIHDRIAAQREERMQPRLMQAGGAILSVDPSTNEVTPIYEAQPDAPEATTLERNLMLLRQLRPDLSDEEAFAIAKQSISGSQGSARPMTYNQGGETITEMLNPDGTRSPVARAPRWQPQKAPQANLPSGFILDN